MSYLISFLPIVFMTCLYSAITKLAGRIFRKTNITWRVCFIYTFAIFFFSGVVKALINLFGVTFNLPMAFVFGLIVQVLFGAWFFSRWARTEEGLLLNPIAAAKLTGVIFILVCVLLIVLFGLYAVVSRFLSMQ
jgi:hypothetical protein